MFRNDPDGKMRTEPSARLKRGLMLCTALVSVAAALAPAPAFAANYYTLGGGAQTLFSADPAIGTPSNTVVNIDTPLSFQVTVNTTTAATSQTTVTNSGAISSPGYGIWALAETSNIAVTVNGTVTASGNGVTIDSSFTPDGGSSTLNGSGSITSTGAAAIWLLADGNPGGANGSVTLDGISGGINGATWGILVDSNGTHAANPGGVVNLGMNTVLGAITAGGNRH